MGQDDTSILPYCAVIKGQTSAKIAVKVSWQRLFPGNISLKYYQQAGSIGLDGAPFRSLLYDNEDPSMNHFKPEKSPLNNCHVML